MSKKRHYPFYPISILSISASNSPSGSFFSCSPSSRLGLTMSVA